MQGFNFEISQGSVENARDKIQDICETSYGASVHSCPMRWIEPDWTGNYLELKMLVQPTFFKFLREKYNPNLPLFMCFATEFMLSWSF